MDTIDRFRKIIQDVLTDLTVIPYAHGQIGFETVFDTESDRFLLMTIGWDDDRRVHGCLVHIDIINGKIWIQRDGTEYGVANELIDRGIPKDQIVLGFHPVDVRPHTEFAVA